MNNEYNPPILPEFKYYSGEAKSDSPFSKDDVRGRYWWGERMFADVHDNERLFTEYMPDVRKWKEWLKKHRPNQSAHLLKTNTDRQLCIALYIVFLYEKWCPGDSDEFIYDY